MMDSLKEKGLPALIGTACLVFGGMWAYGAFASPEPEIKPIRVAAGEPRTRDTKESKPTQRSARSQNTGPQTATIRKERTAPTSSSNRRLPRKPLEKRKVVRPGC